MAFCTDMKYWDTSIIQKALAILKWVLHSKVEITFSFPFPYILAPPHPRPPEIYLNSWGVDSGVRVTCFSQDFWMVFHITKPTIRFWKYYFVSLCCLKLSIFKIKFSLFTLNYYMLPSSLPSHLMQHCQHCHYDYKCCNLRLNLIQRQLKNSTKSNTPSLFSSR